MRNGTAGPALQPRRGELVRQFRGVLRETLQVLRSGEIRLVAAPQLKFGCYQVDGGCADVLQLRVKRQVVLDPRWLAGPQSVLEIDVDQLGEQAGATGTGGQVSVDLGPRLAPPGVLESPDHVLVPVPDAVQQGGGVVHRRIPSGQSIRLL